ncbi:hypothetical protein [Pseudonocardia oceani]|uniref:hypothetical protein n=1 Tax=Pseudonocardia oceani TaxID=2792013 RepID=UPI003FD8407F
MIGYHLARPLGGILFGHIGDRLAREKMLVTKMTLLGVASILIGLLPTPAQIGALAPVLLVVLRCSAPCCWRRGCSPARGSRRRRSSAPWSPTTPHPR